MNLISFEPEDKKRGPVSLAIFFVLAVLVVGLVALMLQGSTMPGKETTQQTSVTNNVLVFVPPPNSPIAFEPKPPSVIPAQTQTAKQSTATPVRSRQYKVSRGDTFGTIARKFHVPVQVIEEANPGVKPNRLKIGQSIQIPAAVTSAPNLSVLARR